MNSNLQILYLMQMHFEFLVENMYVDFQMFFFSFDFFNFRNFRQD